MYVQHIIYMKYTAIRPTHTHTRTTNMSKASSGTEQEKTSKQKKFKKVSKDHSLASQDTATESPSVVATEHEPNVSSSVVATVSEETTVLEHPEMIKPYSVDPVLTNTEEPQPHAAPQSPKLVPALVPIPSPPEMLHVPKTTEDEVDNSKRIRLDPIPIYNETLADITLVSFVTPTSTWKRIINMTQNQDTKERLEISTILGGLQVQWNKNKEAISSLTEPNKRKAYSYLRMREDVYNRACQLDTLSKNLHKAETNLHQLKNETQQLANTIATAKARMDAIHLEEEKLLSQGKPQYDKMKSITEALESDLQQCTEDGVELEKLMQAK